MKAIYAKDIKAMVKQFDLNEAESDYLNDIAESINKERTDLCEDIQMTLLYGSYQVMQWIKGIACTKDRFGKFVECSDTFGLNYLEIA